MSPQTPHDILEAIHEGLEETALLVALGYDASQGRPGRHLLNNSLELLDYGRPINEQGLDSFQPYRGFPDEWIEAIARAVTGSSDAPLREVIAAIKKRQAAPKRSIVRP